MGARYYDPVASRFIQPDTVVPEPRDLQSWNEYSFVRNNPMNRVDPTGNIDVGAEVIGYAVTRLGGNGAAGRFFGSVLGGFVPGAGELADIGVIFSLDHRVGTFERLVATGSLVGNIATAGTAPNAGGAVSHVEEIGEALEEGVESVRSAARSQRAATREAKRQAGIPTSQQPATQSSQRAVDGTKVGRQQTFETPKPGGGIQEKSVQISPDRIGAHAGQSQVEAGNVKPGGQVDSAGRPRIQNEGKVRVDFDPNL